MVHCCWLCFVVFKSSFLGGDVAYVTKLPGFLVLKMNLSVGAEILSSASLSLTILAKKFLFESFFGFQTSNQPVIECSL
jgi:hypothetical protein